ncbi:MAG: hypothetical protein NVSMB9_16350 [Isosphaeraceae bacterium]
MRRTYHPSLLERTGLEFLEDRSLASVMVSDLAPGFNHEGDSGDSNVQSNDLVPREEALSNTQGAGRNDTTGPSSVSSHGQGDFQDLSVYQSPGPGLTMTPLSTPVATDTRAMTQGTAENGIAGAFRFNSQVNGEGNFQDPPVLASSVTHELALSSVLQEGREPSPIAAPEHGEGGETLSTSSAVVQARDATIGGPASMGGGAASPGWAVQGTVLDGRSGDASVSSYSAPAPSVTLLANGASPDEGLSIRVGDDPKAALPVAGDGASPPAIPGGVLGPFPYRPSGTRAQAVPPPRAEPDPDALNTATVWANLMDGSSPLDWASLEQDFRQFLGRFGASEADPGFPDETSGWPFGLAGLAALFVAREASLRYVRRDRRFAHWGNVSRGRALAPTGPWPLGPL